MNLIVMVSYLFLKFSNKFSISRRRIGQASGELAKIEIYGCGVDLHSR